jgi:hypothetical protein
MRPLRPYDEFAQIQHKLFYRIRVFRGNAEVAVKLEDEHTTNPFLRVDDDRIAAAIGLQGAGPVDVFTELRKRRDLFQLQA